MRATKTVHVDQKPDRVMSFFLDSTATPPGMTMTPVYESDDVVGNSYEWTSKVFGIPFNGVTVTTEYVPDERIVFRHFGAMEGTATVTVQPDRGGSEVTLETDTRLAVPLVGRFFDPLMHRGWEQNVEWGKHEIEKREKVTKRAA